MLLLFVAAVVLAQREASALRPAVVSADLRLR